MKTFVIAGGNSGIGLETARALLGDGHRVILLGRDRRKGEDALASFGQAREQATFIASDLSTHDGVRDAGRRVNDIAEHIDGLMLSVGTFAGPDERTADGMNLFFAVGFLGRFHLTQLLLPSLLRAESPRVVMMVAKIDPLLQLDLGVFPTFEKVGFRALIVQMNLANLYYADWLVRNHPKLFAGAVNAGFVRTQIFRNAPLFIKAYVAILGPFQAINIKTAAHNPVLALLSGGGAASYWLKPGDFESRNLLQLDAATGDAMIETVRSVTGV